MTFAERLLKARKKSGLTQAEAALRCKVGKRTYEHWEAGERTPPTEKAVITQERALAAVLWDGLNDQGQMRSAATGSAPWIDTPDRAGRWVVDACDGLGTSLYDADVREICAGVFEAIIHGYSSDWNPVACLPRLRWLFLPNTKLSGPPGPL